MKKLIFTLVCAFVLSACEGDQGPPGPPGTNILGTVFEIDNVYFNPGNFYTFIGLYYDYIPTNIKILPSDVVLIYFYEGTTENGNDIWSLMPQTFYLDGGGIVEYNYNHTVNDFQIFLSGDVNRDTLSPSYTQNQIFRIAILPASFAANPNVDLSNMQSVIENLKAGNPEFRVIDREFWRF